MSNYKRWFNKPYDEIYFARGDGWIENKELIITRLTCAAFVLGTALTLITMWVLR